MIHKLSLTLLLVAGCSHGPDAAPGDGNANSSHSTGDSDPPQDTLDADAATATSAPTGGAEGGDSHGDSAVSGQSGSQSGTSDASTTSVTGETSTGPVVGDSGTSGTSDDTSSSGDTGTTEEFRDTHTGPEPVDCEDAAGPEPVELGSSEDLGAAGSYVLLSKAGITNAAGSSIAGGSVGVSPIAATAITGLSLVADPSNVFSTSVAVVAPWKIYAADYALPTPSKLTTAVLSMQAAYTDAAGRTLPDHLNLNDGDIGGLTLFPGLYTWGSTVIVPTDVTLAGCWNDVWIFQISNDLDVSADVSVILSGGAQARNIFWQIAGQATLHANAHVEGVLLSKTGVTLQTNASLNGRALAQTLIALDDNVVVAP